MKKLLAILMCCLLLTACTTAPAETTDLPKETTVQSESTERESWGLNIFAPNDFGGDDTFATAPIVIYELDANIVLTYLKEYSIVNEEIEVLNFTQEGSHLTIDFNQAFLNQLCSYGTSGEYVFMGCIVNTYLYVYNADTMSITVNGEIIESGHVIYDFPMEFFE